MRSWKILLLIGFVLAVALAIFRVRTLRMRGIDDLKRIRDLYHIQIALALFYDKSPDRRYPVHNPGICQDLDSLKEFLVPAFIPHLPEDPKVRFQRSRYQFGVAQDGQHFVLQALLETKNHPHLISTYDRDGIIFGCMCDDPFYCASP